MTKGGETSRLAGFIAELAWDDVPAEVRERTRYLILDALGCALLGAKLPWSVTAVEGLRALDDGTAGSVWGWGHRTSRSTAALLNGTFIQSFEFDDYYEHGPLHSGSVVVPSLLSTVEGDPSISGEQVLLAAVVGYEVGPRLGVALDGYALLSKGWHCGPIYGVMAASAAASKALGLDAEQIEGALGIAATQASGLMSAQYEAMVKRMHHGFAARNGMIASALAAAGYSGMKGVLERDYGGVRSTFNPDTTDLERTFDGIGRDWWLTGINVKPYAAMAGLHPTIDIASKLWSEDGLTPEDIDSVVIEMPLVPFKHGGWQLTRPPEVVGAQMNCAYAFAVTMCDGAALASQYTPSRVDSDDVWNVLDRVTVVHSQDMDQLAQDTGHKRATRVTVRRRTGEDLVHVVTEATGQGSKLLTNDQIRTKFVALASSVIDRGRVDALDRAVMNLENGGAPPLLEVLADPVAPPF